MTSKMAQARKSPSLSLGQWLDRQLQAAKTGTDAPMTVEDIEAGWAQRFQPAEISELVIPRRTLARRKAQASELSPDEADRAIRLARIQLEADRVFANPEKASRWMRSPNSMFSGQAPISLLRTEAGAMLISETLGQIDHGMFA